MAESASDLNSKLNLWVTDENGNKYVDFGADKEATKQFYLETVNKKTQFHYSLQEKLEYLFTYDYYEPEVWSQYGLEYTIDSRGQYKIVRNEAYEVVKGLYDLVYGKKFRFETYMGALKFDTQYVLKSFDGKENMERYEDRVVANALLLGKGDMKAARNIAEEIVSGRFQPATPTFSNAGKAQRGELISCFLVNTSDDLNSIYRNINSAAQLSKRGGGVAINLTNIREAGAPIKKVENMSSGVVPVMKVLEDTFSYVDQLGSRSGAGAVYLHAHHPDIMAFLDTKRENADEKVRIKTLSLGVVVPDITYELAKKNEEMYLFSPYDIKEVYGTVFTETDISEKYYELLDNPKIRKSKFRMGNKTGARAFFTAIAEISGESGYPYILNVDTANEAHAVDGTISFSNLCSEILQKTTTSTYNEDLSYDVIGNDISCNLGSMNIAKTMEGGSISDTVRAGIRALSSVSDLSNIQSVPSIAKGNRDSRAIGLGQMNLHGFLIKEGIPYGSPESLDFTNIYFMTVAFHAFKESMLKASETGSKFHEFEKSKYANKEYLTEKYADPSMITPGEASNSIFEKYGIDIPTAEDWATLAEDIEEVGLYNAYLQAVPPTGSISYINNSTASIHPITDRLEIRKEGKTGRVYYPQPYVTNENFDQVENAYEIGYTKLIDVYAEATKHVDQGLSMTLFMKAGSTTRDFNKAYIYAHRKGIKTVYYTRLQSDTLEGTEAEMCVSCAL